MLPDDGPSAAEICSKNEQRKYTVSVDRSVGIATGYGLDDRGVGVRVLDVSRMFYSPRRLDWLWDPPNLLSNGYRGALFPGIKRQGGVADHSPPTRAKVKTMWIYTSTHPYAFMAQCLIS
jgi:hypothetical protein